MAQAASDTWLYLALGGALGVAYSLGTEKYLRAMQHRHIFVRNSMLWLSAVTWLCAAAALGWVAERIYNQVGGGLEGFERVLGVLIPAVVRADLLVDWAKRVAWALVNMQTWTEASVQTRNLLSRGVCMPHAVTVDDEVRALVKRADSATDLVASEETIWSQDAESMVRLDDVWKHFEKLGRVAFFSLVGLLGAVPAAALWMLYAVYKSAREFAGQRYWLAVVYLLSILLAPFGAVILLIASAMLLVGVVTLSVVGTVIQFSVYWSIRTVYCIVRVCLSQSWAGFPGLMRPHGEHDAQDIDNSSTRVSLVQSAASRFPEQAGAAIARLGILIPTDLEFTLASWDGYRSGDNKLVESESPDKALDFTTGQPKKKARARALLSKCAKSSRVACSLPCSDTSADASSGTDMNSMNVAIDHAKARYAKAASLLTRLGMDMTSGSRRGRRLSTYYALGMLVQLQVDSGGNAWCLSHVDDLSDEDFEERIKSFDSHVANEAKEAVYELTDRLRGSSRFRVLPSGSSSGMVPVGRWLRAVLLMFLDNPVSDLEVALPCGLNDTKNMCEFSRKGSANDTALG